MKQAALVVPHCRRRVRGVFWILGLLCCGALFSALCALCRKDINLGPFDTVVFCFYRLCYMFMLPVHMVISALGWRDGSRNEVANHWTAVSFATPWAYAIVWVSRCHIIRWHKRFRANLRRLRMQSSAKAPADSAPTLNRRDFFERSLTWGATAGLGLVSVDSTCFAPQRLHVRRYCIPIIGLPQSLEGLRIVHVSDTHYGPFISHRFLEQVAQRVLAERPDVVALTGDYVHRSEEAIVPGIEILGRMRGRLATVAVLGNHDHYQGAEKARRELARQQIELLENRSLFLSADGLSETPGPASLCLAGLGDLWEGRVEPESTLRKVPDSMPRVMLMHNPDGAEELAAWPGGPWRVDLMLSGHTHGGQIRLPILGTVGGSIVHRDKYMGGLCQGPAFPVIVSRGVGMALLPVRMGVPPEIGVIELTAAS